MTYEADHLEKQTNKQKTFQGINSSKTTGGPDSVGVR